jgi:hypothetical protein
VLNGWFVANIPGGNKDYCKNPVDDRGFPLKEVGVPENYGGNTKQHHGSNGNPLKFIQSPLCGKQAAIHQDGTREQKFGCAENAPNAMLEITDGDTAFIHRPHSEKNQQGDEINKLFHVASGLDYCSKVVIIMDL